MSLAVAIRKTEAVRSCIHVSSDPNIRRDRPPSVLSLAAEANAFSISSSAAELVRHPPKIAEVPARGLTRTLRAHRGVHRGALGVHARERPRAENAATRATLSSAGDDASRSGKLWILEPRRIPSRQLRGRRGEGLSDGAHRRRARHGRLAREHDFAAPQVVVKYTLRERCKLPSGRVSQFALASRLVPACSSVSASPAAADSISRCP